MANTPNGGGEPENAAHLNLNDLPGLCGLSIESNVGFAFDGVNSDQFVGFVGAVRMTWGRNSDDLTPDEAEQIGKMFFAAAADARSGETVAQNFHNQTGDAKAAIAILTLCAPVGIVVGADKERGE